MSGKKKLFLFLTIIVLAFLLNFFPTGYLITRPGVAEDLKQLIKVEGNNYEADGAFYLITVIQHKATVPWLLYAFVHPHINSFPAPTEEQEYRKLLEMWMEESQLLAKLISLRTAGYGDSVKISGGGIGVHGFTEGSPSEGELLIDDVILTVDGEEVFFANQVIAIVQNRQVGDTVELKVRRSEDEFFLNLPTVEHDEENGRPVLGIYITALGDWDISLPFDIEIATGQISGPSAGMMFVLEIINQLSPEDITGGYNIAGTGTINYFEEIGMIGGVKQKIVTAEREGADYFLVPQGNYEEAMTAARKTKVVPVKNLKDVMGFLDTLTQ